MKFLNIGDLIKEYRMQLNINQADLTMGKMSIATISLVEKGKLKITPILAVLLSDNINRLAKSKGMSLSITADELLTPEEMRCRTWCQDEINRIDKYPEDNTKDVIVEYEEVLDAATEYNLEDIIVIVRDKLGVCYHGLKKYKESLEHFKACLAIYQRGNDLFKIADAMKCVGACYFYVDKKQSIEYFKNTYELIKDQKTNIEFSDLISSTLYNMALYYADEMNDFKAAGDYLEEIDIANVKRIKLYINIMKLKAVAKITMKEYSSALEICEKLLTISDSHVEACKPGIYNSMATCLKYLGQYEKAMQYYDLAINQMLKSNSEFLDFNVPRMLFNAANMYLKNSKPDLAISYVKLAMDYAKAHEQSDYIVMCYHIYYKIYKYLGNLKKCSEVLDECEKFIIDNYLSNEFKYKNQLLKIDLSVSREDYKSIKDLAENVLSEEDCFVGA